MASIASRGELDAHIVDEIAGLADLIALDRAAAHRERMLALGDELDAATDRLAHVRAASNATAGLAAGLAGVAVLAHAEPGASYAAVGGWAILLASFLYLVTMPELEP